MVRRVGADGADGATGDADGGADAAAVADADEKADAEAAALRGSQVGSGDRSEKIRTYNYKENRVTDHRIGLTIHKLDRIGAGELDEISDALIAEERRRQLEDDE